ncbi:4,5-DOPA dioxygenase extradiol [Papillibacter cinnamivorans]|uniref:Aromatic ring-opening dioxygenase, catalytic subunit, LigB family n=1 Tax=Papillibacter cinnamivorans DSM 12816 TaxID=1122930 RepID=A0A1W2A6K2_9FIRM|nr:4,5-DOPA dioxygenase extradiol [Papillibacter cinnamivorans]SMC56297.1 Aromatic ring-opening dioxygenase, catalytic subunit, LigB family [Papillibacter cinnamivorans DSM 12816]
MKKMPVLFIGHGSPMNAIEDNPFTRQWEALGEKLPRPDAILCVSAHWFTRGTRVNDAETPATIYDMYGFPEELYKVVYNAKGAPSYANLARNTISRQVTTDNTWGIDHGTWSVLCRMYPKADIPVFQLSVDKLAAPGEHYAIGRELRPLREKGVLILGSGNVVHNLSRIQWGMDGGYSWAMEFDAYIKENILGRKDDNVIGYHKAGPSASMAFTTLDHYAPLLYVLGAAEEKEQVTVLNDACVLGSLSMTSYLFEP